MTAKIVSLEAYRREPDHPVGIEEFMDLVETIERYIREIHQKEIQKLGLAQKLIHEIKFSARFDFNFRQEAYPHLHRLADDLYLMVNEIDENE